MLTATPGSQPPRLHRGAPRPGDGAADPAVGMPDRARRDFSDVVVFARAQHTTVDTDRCMTTHHTTVRPDDLAAIIDTYGVVDAKGLAAMIGLSHRTVMVYAAEAAWRTGHLPPPVYIGRSVHTRDGRGRRWRRVTVRAWLAAADAEYRGEVA